MGLVMGGFMGSLDNMGVWLLVEGEDIMLGWGVVCWGVCNWGMLVSSIWGLVRGVMGLGIGEYFF